MFPGDTQLTASTMNYTDIINGGIWLLSLAYFFTYGYKHYHGPKSDVNSVDEEDMSSAESIHVQLEEKH